MNVIEQSGYIRPARRESIYRWFLRRTRKLTERQVLALLAIFVGMAAGFGTYLFELMLYGIKSCLVSWFDVQSYHFLFIIYPTIGIILATLFVKYIVKDNISAGVTRVLYAMSSRGSRIAGHNCWTSIVGGATTIGFGGSVGPEAPIVLTGAAIGSNIGKLARLNYKNITLLLCCGSGAALAAIFKAPITGVIFVLEILMLDITSASIIPLLIATITSTTIAIILRGFDPLISFEVGREGTFALRQIPLFIVLGCLCGLISYYFTSMNALVGRFFQKISNQYVKWIAGGLVLGGLIFLFPALYGEGYESFTELMNGSTDALFNNSIFWPYRNTMWLVLCYIIAVIFFKVIAMATTNASGGVGGTFAPSLFVGAFMGAATSIFCNLMFEWDLSIAVFTLVGMAGVMSAVMNAPLTAIFLIAEVSNGYSLFIPLMITSCIAFAVDYYLNPDSIYTKQLRERGELLTHDKDSSVLVFLKLQDLMETDFVRIKENNTLGDIVSIISTAHRNIFPVIDNFGILLGVVQLDDLREDMFKPQKWGTPITAYMIQPPDKILENEQMQEIIPRFEQNHTWMLPVVDARNHYKGFISKSRILDAYREKLKRISQ